MPRYYCDYCDTYLTHDSPSVRKQHNQGYKHKANVRSYYQQFEEQQTQSLIDQKVKEHLGQTAAFQQQLGASFVLQSGQYRPPISAPVLPRPSLPVPGTNSVASASPMLHPPVLPRPAGMSQGYVPPPTFRPPMGAASQANGLPRPPALATPSAAGVRPVIATSPSTANGSLSNLPTSGPPGAYQQQSTIPAGNSYGSYNYTGPPMGPSGGYTQAPNMTSIPPGNSSSGFTSQQPVRAGPPGTTPQGNFIYGQSPQGPPGSSTSTPGSYGPSATGASAGYRS